MKFLIISLIILNTIQINPINLSILSGAIDIIAVEGQDGMIRSSPFWVRFGYNKIKHPLDKQVLYCNIGIHKSQW
jgi:phosphatidate phosphatase PAH1